MNSQFSAVLLAGGQSIRMGRDKAEIQIDGTPLWQRQIRILEQLELKEIFVAGPERNRPHGSTCIFIADAMPNTGPLGGLVAALRRCSTAYLLALAVDLPAMTAAYLGQLPRDCMNGAGVVPTHGDRHEPLVAVYPLDAVRMAETALMEGDYSLQKLCASGVANRWLNQRAILPHEESLFQNMNTPEDLLVLTDV